MPIFEYVCGDCNSRFETLVRSGSVVACPSCESTTVEKQLSVFATAVKGESSATSDMPVGACGMCGDPRGPGGCSSQG